MISFQKILSGRGEKKGRAGPDPDAGQALIVRKSAPLSGAGRRRKFLGLVPGRERLQKTLAFLGRCLMIAIDNNKLVLPENPVASRQDLGQSVVTPPPWKNITAV